MVDVEVVVVETWWNSDGGKCALEEVLFRYGLETGWLWLFTVGRVISKTSDLIDVMGEIDG